jgi:hypothetical protein
MPMDVFQKTVCNSYKYINRKTTQLPLILVIGLAPENGLLRLSASGFFTGSRTGDSKFSKGTTGFAKGGKSVFRRGSLFTMRERAGNFAGKLRLNSITASFYHAYRVFRVKHI